MKLIPHIQSALTMQTDEPRQYIGASSIGNQCLRAIWYGLRMSETKVVEPQQQLAFEVGKRLEILILDLLVASGIHIERQFGFHCREYSLFQGTLDAVLFDNVGNSTAIIEIKTAKNDSFRIFQRKGVRLWWPEYYDQVQCYMGMSGIAESIILVFNKDASELCEEVIEFDPIWYASLVEKAKIVGEYTEPPPRLSERPAFFKCKMCFYKEECHK